MNERPVSIMSESLARTLRTIIQVIASGGLTGIVALITDGLSPFLAAGVLAVSQVVVTYSQNVLEERDIIPSVFKPQS